MNASKLIENRKEYVERIRKELLGPGSEISFPDEEHEVISVSPQTRYSIGVLFPKGKAIGADNDSESAIEENSDADIEGSDSFDDAEDDDGSERRPEKEYYDETDRPYDSEENLDEEVALSAQNKPSSAGISFFVKGQCDITRCIIRFATYRRVKPEECATPFEPMSVENYEVPGLMRGKVFYDSENRMLRLSGKIDRHSVYAFRESLDTDEDNLTDALYKLASQCTKGYKREPHESAVTIDFRDNNYVEADSEIDNSPLKVTAFRRVMDNGSVSVTIMAVNDCDKPVSAENCIFQPEIIVNTDDNEFVFCEYGADFNPEFADIEEQSLALQYRNKKVYVTGLGTSASWNIALDGTGMIKSNFFPMSEVPGMEFELPEEYDIQANAVSMKYLSDLDHTSKSEKIRGLRTITDAYHKWIAKKKEEATNHLDRKKYGRIADYNLNGCDESFQRMEKGIKILEEDDTAWQAFSLANRAMYMQRIRLALQKSTSDRDRFDGDEELEKKLQTLDYHTADEVYRDPYKWRPFQISFLLMSVDSVTNDSPGGDRGIVDLIWFPTGGGKTEAYLGLTAFTIFYRRLKFSDNYDGTTVMMRYTLRLLAAQQFTRAATLICACEVMRKDAVSKKPRYGKYELGKNPITIGLWIGREHTPNDNNTAKRELDFLNQAQARNLRDVKDKHNKFQLLKCPWCGTKLVRESDGNKRMGDFGYRMSKGHFELFCPQQECDFYDKLPIQVVDEELYNNPPTLLFGTVDKFAMLPWDDRIGSFFALNTDNRSPELIIQDELHLISGPLGTMVGLYETVIDELCRAKGSYAKVVASTATIRRAKDQCSSLYNRDVMQFPHPALDAEDSFFARERKVDHENGQFGRLYVGLMPSEKSKAMMEVRSIAALLQQANVMDLSDDERDKLWTLTVYFNSLKDLGKCSTLVDDDVKDFIKRTAFRLGTARDARRIAYADELTSRVSTTELNETLDKLEKISYSEENIKNKRYASNVLLATNMISVGIDVERLNVMLLVGQPKLTSEYIQASSRVGRRFPGVAFVMYDGTKSRDRSHYEQFVSYHESFYRFVEPTGITPFSKPARDRGLHAVVTALIRNTVPELREDTAAWKFNLNEYKAMVDAITERIINRDKEIVRRSGLDIEDESDEIREEIGTFIEKWDEDARTFGKDHFVYGRQYLVTAPSAEDKIGRLLKVFNTSLYENANETMTSMRNVDSSSGINVLVWED